jgi:hypothetical protein
LTQPSESFSCRHSSRRDASLGCCKTLKEGIPWDLSKFVRCEIHCCRPRSRYADESSKSLSLVTSGACTFRARNLFSLDLRRLYLPARSAHWLHVPHPENTEEEAKRAKKDGEELRALVKEYSQQALKFADLATSPDWNGLLGGCIDKDEKSDGGPHGSDCNHVKATVQMDEATLQMVQVAIFRSTLFDLLCRTATPCIHCLLYRTVERSC